MELNEYGLKKFKSKVQSKLDDKKTKLKGDRPLSLYEQDLLGDLIGDEEFEEFNEVRILPPTCFRLEHFLQL